MIVKMSARDVIDHAKQMATIVMDTFNGEEGKYAEGIITGAKIVWEVLDRYNFDTQEYDFREIKSLEAEYAPTEKGGK